MNQTTVRMKTKTGSQKLRQIKYQIDGRCKTFWKSTMNEKRKQPAKIERNGKNFHSAEDRSRQSGIVLESDALLLQKCVTDVLGQKNEKRFVSQVH